MDWYLIFKFLHVASAVLWLGGGLFMVLLGAKADRAKDDADLVDIIRLVAWASDRIYIPASLATLIFGVTTAWLGNLWSSLWVNLGFVGIVSTIALGVLVLSARAKKVAAEKGVTPRAVELSREILTIAKFDMTVLYVVIADMVLKPELSDWGWLVAFAVAIVAAAALWLTPVLRKPATI
jgi:uncharacterized membrane protein